MTAIEDRHLTCETAHHYILAEPGGPLVAGACKRCGYTREWVAWPEGLDSWNDFRPAGTHSLRSKRAKQASDAAKQRRERAMPGDRV